ncbi:sulfotransferase [Solicola gregarius]|uniref:Sulfotransferase n=1 Tax=Solicola gregarius TaxID=2908642 RepID=A0AA46YNP2_9ACTN|nr:sulfotransferase [Solicola gregarius]UYM07829.1 sulfotransferase [Solicola gregarius]
MQPRPAADRVSVLYVGGMPRSGSTLTDLMLDQLPDHVGVGEIFYLWEDALVRNAPCACGAAFNDCTFWQDVGELAYGGWESVDTAHIQRLQRTVDVTAAIPKLVRRRRSAEFESALREYTGILTDLYRAIVEVSGRQVVVDSSKRPSMAYVLRQARAVDLRVAHVVRDPRGVAYSFSKVVEVDRGTGVPNRMPRSRPLKTARRWLTVNLAIGALDRLGVPTARLRYEDLVTEPQRHLSRVLEIEDRSAACDWAFLGDGKVDVPHTHAIAAGRVSRASGTVPLRRDDAWRETMPPGDRRLVSALTAPLRSWYGY